MNDSANECDHGADRAVLGTTGEDTPAVGNGVEHERDDVLPGVDAPLAAAPRYDDAYLQARSATHRLS
jgi:hypothetical protein